MSTLVAMFVLAYNVGHLVSLAVISAAWVLLQHFWVHEWHERDWALIGTLGATGLSLGVLTRLAQRRSFDFMPWYNGNDDAELKAIGVALLVTFAGLNSYDDIIQLCASHDTSAQFPLGKIRSMLVCVLVLLFLYVAENKWHEWSWLSVASKVYNTGEGLAAVMDTEKADALRTAYLTQATLVSLLICGDVLVFLAVRNAMLDADLFGLLAVYAILLSIFKTITANWHKDE